MIYIDTEEWLEGRYQGIGGSEAGIVAGVNPWKSRLELWNEKISKTRHLDPNAELRLKLGNILEPFIAEEYSSKTGRQLEIREQKAHPVYPFILGNIDREIIVSDRRSPGILEIKTKGAYTDWQDEDIPIYYRAQLQHYLNIYDYTWGSFAVLDLGSMKLNIIDVDRDDEFISNLLKEEIAFWKLVEDRIPPDPDASKACGEFLREQYQESEPITIDISENEDATKWASKLKQAKDYIKLTEAIEIEAKNHLMSIMGSAEKAEGHDFNISWKSPRDKEKFDLEKFKFDHPDIAKEYISCEPQSRRFTVRWHTSMKNKHTSTKNNEQNVLGYYI